MEYRSVRICIIFYYSHCAKNYHYANLILPSNIEYKKIECIFKKMHDSFCNENFYSRNDKLSDGEFLFLKVCAENNWGYSDFTEACIDDDKNSSLQSSSDDLAKHLRIELANYVFSIYDDF